MKSVMSAVAILIFCGSALAANGSPDGAGLASGQKISWAKYHHVFGRLGLTEEQIKKMDAIYFEYQTKITNAYRSAYDQTKKMTRQERQEASKKARETVAELNAERDKKLLEVLTEEQRKKHELALKIMTEFADKGKELNKGYVEIRQIKDNAKKREAYKILGEKRRKIYADRDKELDEKIGTLPQRPASDETGGQLTNPNSRPQGGTR